MDQFNSMLPDGMSASCLEDLPTFRRFLAHELKASRVKANPVIRAYALFSRLEGQENSGISASELMFSGVSDKT